MTIISEKVWLHCHPSQRSIIKHKTMAHRSALCYNLWDIYQMYPQILHSCVQHTRSRQKSLASVAEIIFNNVSLSHNCSWIGFNYYNRPQHSGSYRWITSMPTLLICRETGIIWVHLLNMYIKYEHPSSILSTKMEIERQIPHISYIYCKC